MPFASGSGSARGTLLGPPLLLLLAALLGAILWGGGPRAAARRIGWHLRHVLRSMPARSERASPKAPNERRAGTEPPTPPGAPGWERARFVLGDDLTSLGPLSATRPIVPPSSEDPLGEGLGNGRIVTGAVKHRLLLLSLDDGPGLQSTARVLDVLARHHLEAIFFLTTSWLAPGQPGWRRRRAMARRIAAAGHLVGAHGFQHAQLPLMRDAEVSEELDRTEALFREVLGGAPRLFRPPGGARSARTDQHIEGRGWTQVLWNLGTGDTQSRDPKRIVRTFWRVLARRQAEHDERGGIVLMHDIHPWSPEALQALLTSVAERNCELWRAGEELYDWPSPTDALRWFVQPRAPQHFGAEAAFPSIPPRWLEARQARLRRRAARRCGPPTLGPLAQR